MTQREFETCMARMKRGEKDGLRKIYEEYKTYLYSIIYSIVSDRQDAEDLTSECFLHIWKAADQFIPGGTHKAYLASIARNLSLDYLRKQNREEVLAIALGEKEEAATASAEQEALSAMNLRDMLAHLPAVERQIIILKMEGDLTFKEISALMGLPMGTVTWKYRKALDTLRRGAA